MNKTEMIEKEELVLEKIYTLYEATGGFFDMDELNDSYVINDQIIDVKDELNYNKEVLKEDFRDMNVVDRINELNIVLNKFNDEKHVLVKNEHGQIVLLTEDDLNELNDYLTDELLSYGYISVFGN